jgi:hypothetical protein
MCPIFLAEPAQSDHDADREADAMKVRLHKDVASWSAARSDGSARLETGLSVATARQPSVEPAKRVRRAKPAASDVKPQVGSKKPFSMSYDGVTQADYITYMIARGAR